MLIVICGRIVIIALVTIIKIIIQIKKTNAKHITITHKNIQ